VKDGVTGTCRPLAAPADEAADLVDGTFTTNVTNLSFSNIATEAVITVSNQSPRRQVFTVRKVASVTADNPADPNPLFWLRLGQAPLLADGSTPAASAVNAAQVPSIEVAVESGDTMAIAVRNAANENYPVWDGVLEISNARLGVRRLPMSYIQRPDGQWAGKMFYFGQFNIDAAAFQQWLNQGRLANAPVQLGNSLLNRWVDLRRGQLPVEGFDAMLQSLFSESWRFGSVRQACEDRPLSQAPVQVCYPVVGGDLAGGSLRAHTTDNSRQPVPTGLVEMPFAMNLRAAAGDPTRLEGRIATDAALQYAGYPSIAQFSLGVDPSGGAESVCNAAVISGGVNQCATSIRSFEARIVVGGRFHSNAPDTDCPAAHPTLAKVSYPWLLDGFITAPGVAQLPSGAYERSECRHKAAPTGNSADAVENLNLAGSNPIPDGRARVRTLSLIDGLLIDQSRMLILFKESYGSIVGAASENAAYGLMELRRNPTSLSGEDFVGTAQQDPAPDAATALGAACTADLLALNSERLGQPLTANLVAARVGLMMNGVAAAPPEASYITRAPVGDFSGDADPEYAVHYVCHTTGRFDDCAANGQRFDECPEGSGVSFLRFSREALGDVDFCGLPCNRDGSCLGLVETSDPDDPEAVATPTRWLEAHGGELNPAWRCAQANAVLCDSNRVDLRAEKRFFRPQDANGNAVDEPAFQSFVSATADAFRYKTRFQNREGTNLGFAPRRCVPGSEAMQYCYDPVEIQQLADRLDCTLATYMNDSARALLGGLQAGAGSTLAEVTRDFLLEAFGAAEPAAGEPGFTRQGFESLYAELMVMLGDEAYTSAFASRFDLAGLRGGAFLGSQFEVGGFDLAGPAGFEMRSLYQATQAYQIVLDRFYRNSSTLWPSLGLALSQRVVDARTLVYYLTKLVRASSQKARSFSAIAERYQSFNRPDLARRVIERAYASAYIESMAMNRFLGDLRQNAPARERDQIDVERERAQRVYSSALLEMRDVYQGISDNLTLFGLPPDYIPFPALGPSDTNAFEVLLQRAQEKLRVASDKEERALEQNRAYETDRASFERELTQVKNNYEDRLAQICGTFETADGRVLPAIAKYAELSPETNLMGNPCGFVGNGEIFQAAGSVEVARLDLQRVVRTADGVNARIAIEEERVRQVCGNVNFTLARQIGNQQATFDLNERIRGARARMRNSAAIEEGAKIVADGIQAAAQSGFAAGLAIYGSVLKTQAFMLKVSETEIAQNQIDEAERGMEDLRLAEMRTDAAAQCGQDRNRDGIDDRGPNAPAGRVQIDSAATIKNLALELETNAVDALKASYEIKLRVSEILRLKNEATRLANEQTEAEQLAINVEAARNDPNTRIYKNDAILSADRTFRAALVDAYKATRVFEYYTSQSYAHLNDLFLVRLVARGDITLENYLADLTDAFHEFEETYGNPDTRVAVLSAKDDLLSIPRLDDEGRPLSGMERTRRFREAITDTRLLDASGYLSMPFGTSIASLSPLTRDHKVLYVEATLDGAGLGDAVGRLYLRQSGTGAVRGVGDGTTYYRFPERTAVINPSFNAQKVFAPETYRNERLRDRPFVNSNWELLLNQRDEQVNQDIDLNSLDDMRIFVYYTDFTEL